DKLLAPVSGTDTFDHPALFIRGGKSEHITDDDFPKIREMFPQAELATVAGAGHWVHADAPDELFGLVMSFFKNDH
ncbi:MAG TPA: alpha/beta hydrolase, partial [Saprospiraceae bacterium]|nr:alpha/beta hydrolase [Saprospiraceae bacterium]